MQVNDLDSSDSSMTRATSPGYLRYPPPAVLVTNVQSREHVSLTAELPPVPLPLFFVPSFPVENIRIDNNQHASSSAMQVEYSASLQFQRDANAAESNLASPMEAYSAIPSSIYSGTEGTMRNSFPTGEGTGTTGPAEDAMETDETKPTLASLLEKSNLDLLGGGNNALGGEFRQMSGRQQSLDFRQIHHLLPARDPTWELPFFQGWLMGRSQVGAPTTFPHTIASHEQPSQNAGSSLLASHISAQDVEAAVTVSAMLGGSSLSGASVRSGWRHRSSRSRFSVTESVENIMPSNSQQDGSDSQPIFNRIQSEIATSLAAVAAAELPCTVKLKVWSHDIENPCVPLNADKCRLTISHAVLCRYVENKIIF